MHSVMKPVIFQMNILMLMNTFSFRGGIYIKGTNTIGTYNSNQMIYCHMEHVDFDFYVNIYLYGI